MRKRKNPPISGAEAQNISVMANAMPKEEYNKQLQDLINEIDNRQGMADHRARLMIIGSILDDSNYTGIIEELGGLIVTDVSCFGTISFWEPIKLNGDPIDSIARAYLNRIPCPRMPGKQITRKKYIDEMAKAFAVDGIIFERMMYCNFWGGETMSIEKDLQELNIPLLILDREYIQSGLGQLRTRVQAFLEMIEVG